MFGRIDTGKAAKNVREACFVIGFQLNCIKSLSVCYLKDSIARRARIWKKASGVMSTLLADLQT